MTHDTKLARFLRVAYGLSWTMAERWARIYYMASVTGISAQRMSRLVAKS